MPQTQSDAPVAKLIVALSPPRHVSRELIQVAETLLPNDAAYRIDGTTFLPHMTIFAPTFRTGTTVEAKERLLSRVRKEELGPLSCVATGVAITPNGFVEVSYAKSEALGDLQNAVISALTPLVVPAESVPEHPIPSQQAENVRRFGYDLVGDLFRPHVTLGRVSESRQVELSWPDFASLSFEASKIVLLETDANGAGREIHWSFVL